MEQPLLVALDDLQWCDPPSLRTLEFALRRVDSEQIGLAAGTSVGRRAGDPGPGGKRTPHRRRGRPARRGQRLRPSCVAGNRLPRPVLRQLYVACDGNPLFGKEVAALLAEHGLPDDPAALIPVPPSASDAIGRRVAKLGLGTRDVLLGAAALPRPTVDVLLAAYGERKARGRARGGGCSRDRGRRPRASPLHPSTRRRGGLRGRHAGSSSRRARGARTGARPPGGTGAAARACHHPSQRRRRSGARVGRRGREGARGARHRRPTAGAGGDDHAGPRPRCARRRRGLEAARCHLAAGDTERARSLLDRLAPALDSPVRSRRRSCSSWRSPTEATPSGDATTPTPHSSRRSRARRSRSASTTASPSFTSAPARPSCAAEHGQRCAHDRRDARGRGDARGGSRQRRIRRLRRPAGPPAWTTSSGLRRSSADSGTSSAITREMDR